MKSEIQEIIPIKKEGFGGVDQEKRAVFSGRPGLAAHGVKTIGKRASKKMALWAVGATAAASRYIGRVVALQFIALGGTFTPCFFPCFFPSPSLALFISLIFPSLSSRFSPFWWFGGWKQVLPFLWRWSLLVTAVR